MQIAHLVWNTNPVMVDIGTLHLPFPVSVWGLVLAVVIIWLGYSKLTPEAEDDEKKQPEPEAWKVWALVIGAFIVGQLIFSVLPSPVIRQIGPIRPRWYGLMFALGFVFGYFVMFRMFKHAGLTQDDLDRLLFYILIATVIGARLGQIFFYDFNFYLHHPAQIIMIWHGGLASHGAAIGILVAMYLYERKYPDMDYLWLADRVVVVVASGGAFIRIGNFFNSEIVGKPSNLPWAIIFPRAHVSPAYVPRHPSMLYESLLCIFTFCLLWAMYKHYKNKPPEGSMFATFLVVIFGIRFYLEFFKTHQAHFPTPIFDMGQWLSIPLVIAGLWIMIFKVNWKERSVYEKK
ncbi:MAG TPA: prolipoprotein diacylglyceryl transferase, partial [Balneolaceae bacterium]|nr:prolipoprotein diacylglyceryl transferase [Balneolaceae bacterium]